MGRGGNSKASTAQNLLYGRRRLGTRPQVKQLNFSETLRLIERNSSGAFFRNLGLDVTAISRDDIYYANAKNREQLPDYCKESLIIELQADEHDFKLDCYYESEDDFLVSFVRSKIVGEAESKVLRKLAALDREQIKVKVEFNVDSLKHFNDFWREEISDSDWEVSDNEILFPIKQESEIIKDLYENYQKPLAATNLQEMLADQDGQEIIEDQVRQGLLYLRTSLDRWRD